MDNMSGKERGSRYDWKALPRGEADVITGEIATAGLSYVADQCEVKGELSNAADDARLGPMGWMETTWDTSSPGEEPIYVRRKDTFSVLFDPFSRDRDLKDARYLIEYRNVDLDNAITAWPDKAEALQQAAKAARFDEGVTEARGADYGNRVSRLSTSTTEGVPPDYSPARKRLLVRSHQWWKNERTEFLVLPDGQSFEWEAALERPDLMDLLNAPGAQRVPGMKRCYYVTIVAGELLLSHEANELPFQRFTLVPVWGYRDREGRPRGILHRALDPQREVNVTNSRANEALRSRYAIYQEGALGDTSERDLARKLGRGNFVLKVDDPAKVVIQSDKQDFGAWMNLYQKSAAAVDEAVGQNEVAYGDTSPEVSGIAIQTKVAQQAQTAGTLFDNLRFARREVGRRVLAMMQWGYSTAKLARIVEAGALRAGAIDKLKAAGAGYADIIQQTKYDLVVEDQAETATDRQANMHVATELIGMVQGTPAAAAMVPDVIRMSDFGGKDEMARKVEAALLPPPPMVGPGPADPGPLPEGVIA
jgi:hypothetical protein